MTELQEKEKKPAFFERKLGESYARERLEYLNWVLGIELSIKLWT